jgi:hypothetical protein
MPAATDIPEQPPAALTAKPGVHVVHVSLLHVWHCAPKRSMHSRQTVSVVGGTQEDSWNCVLLHTMQPAYTVRII